jgi:hypothetical protein
MQVSLIWEDRFAIEQDLLWEFKNTDKKIGINGLQKIILDSFKEASEFFRLQSTLPFSESEIEIRVLLRSPENNITLAYFDLSRINPESKKFYFKLYADVLFPLVKNENLAPLKSIWIHEIMHMVDYPELMTNLKLYKKIETISEPLFYVIKSGKRKDKHIIFLQLILQFRQEGVATLLEFISGGTLTLAPTKDAVEIFKNISDSAFILSESPDLHSKQISLFFEETISPLAYQIGAGIILYGLIKKHPENKEFIEIENCLKDKVEYTLSEPDKIIIINKIRDFSSFDFIHYCFDPESVYWNIFDLTSDYADNLEIYKSFFSTLQRLSNMKDRNGFVWMIRTIIGSPMTVEEIKVAHLGHKSIQVMPEELLTKAETLYNHFLKNEYDEVAVWALTYLYDQVDILDDSIEYFGYLDDMAVVDTAIKLISELN